MTRYEFISQLKEKLYLLNENECRDIIEEYMSHIDMKMAEGKTETEAIKDFGNIDDLVSEILAAYHIDSTKLKDNPPPVQKTSFTDSITVPFKKLSACFRNKTDRIKNSVAEKKRKLAQKQENRKAKRTEPVEKTETEKRNLMAGFGGKVKNITAKIAAVVKKLTVISVKATAFLCIWAPCAALTVAAVVCTVVATVIYFTTGVGFAGVCIAGLGCCIIGCGITLWLTELLAGGKAKNA